MARIGKKRNKEEVMWNGKIEKRWDIELWATDVIYRLLMFLPSWAMRFQALGDASVRLKGQMLWEKRANGRKV